MNIAFTLIGGKHWTGGYNYLLNLLSVLADKAPGKTQAILFAGSDVDDSDLTPFQNISGCTCVKTPALRAGRRWLSTASSLVLGRDPAVSVLFSKYNIDILFEASTFLGWRIGLPAIAWLTDMQHKDIPHFFSHAERWKREFAYRLRMATGRTVMLSSGDSLHRFSKHYPWYAGRTHIVRFAVPQPLTDDDGVDTAINRYGLPEHFYFMPNQYWAHKNHRLVVAALSILKERGLAATIFASGNQFDHRHPQHIFELRAAVNAAGLSEQFLMPGMIPRHDLTSLMRACVAVINPSLFEGWSTTVEEARSLGTPLLLSDIPVHREQAGDDAIYFDPSSPASLADALVNFKPLDLYARYRRLNDARESANRRTEQFAKDFISLARSTLEHG